MLLFLTKKIFKNMYTIKFVIYVLISAFIILPPTYALIITNTFI